METLNKLEYLNGFIKEALRMGGPVGLLFNRVAVKDHNIGTLKVKSGTLLTVPVNAINYNQEYFENPFEFIPERFTHNSPFPNEKHKNEPFSFVAFSGGPKNCIGQYLAMLEAKIILVELINTFKVEYEPGTKIVMSQRFVYESDQPFRANFIPLNKK